MNNNYCIELPVPKSNSRIEENKLIQLQKSINSLGKFTSDFCNQMDVICNRIVIIERRNKRKNVCSNKSVSVPCLNLQNTFVTKENFLNNNNKNKKNTCSEDLSTLVTVVVPKEEENFKNSMKNSTF